MAKRKLSPQQRETVRKDIRQLVAQKKMQADVLRAIAGKYHITPITARWYYKSVVKTGKQVSQSKQNVSQVTEKTARRPRIHVANGAALRIVHQVQSLADKSFRRVVEARKLIPKWQVYVKKEATLRKLEDKVRSELRMVSQKATALHRRIRSLTSH
jgi:hypothetical protein